MIFNDPKSRRETKGNKCCTVVFIYFIGNDKFNKVSISLYKLKFKEHRE